MPNTTNAKTILNAMIPSKLTMFVGKRMSIIKIRVMTLQPVKNDISNILFNSGKSDFPCAL